MKNMPIAQAKIILKCLKTGEAIEAGKACAECNLFSHISYRGAFTPLIMCRYEGKAREQKRPVEEKPVEEKAIEEKTKPKDHMNEYF